MPNIKLKDGSGIEQTYTNIQSITVPLADGTGNMTYGVNAKMLPQQYNNQYWGLWNLGQLEDYDAIDAISTVPISSMTYMFAGISVIDLDNITINPSLEANTGLSLDYCIGGNSNNNSAKIISLPVINNFILSHASNLFAYTDWSDSTITPNEFIESIDGLSEYYYNAEGTKSTNGSPYLDGMFSYSNIEELDLSHLGHGGLNWNYNSNYIIAGYKSFLKSITCFINQSTLTSNKDMLSPGMNLMLGHFKYETNNGVPYTANWKSQSIDFSQASQYAIGWLPSNWSLGVTLPWTNITPSSSTTLAETTLMYNNLKNTNTRWGCLGGSANNNTTYTASDGNSYSCKIGRLFSHYNHSSAVETINSLPDTSAYLAAQGGTNTIKFHPASGGLTDEGEVGLLTAEEIAVATAKGWTVTFSAYTN